MRELVRGLGGRVEEAVRDLKDFQASSMLWVRRDLWRVDCKVTFSCGVRVCWPGGCSGF